VLHFAKLASSVPGAFLTGACVLLAAAAAGELAYHAGLAALPSAIHRYVRTPATTAYPTAISGSAKERLDALRIKAHWSKPEVQPVLERFLADGGAFYELFHSKAGHLNAHKQYEERAEARSMLDRRDSYFAAMVQIDPSIRVSEHSAESNALSAGEKMLLQHGKAITDAYETLRAKPRESSLVQARLGEFTSALVNATDIFIDPSISTAILRRVVDEAFVIPAERDAVAFRQAVQRMASTKDAGAVHAMGREPLLAFLPPGLACDYSYQCSRDVALARIGRPIVAKAAKKLALLRQIDRDPTSAETATLIGDAYLDSDLATDDLREVAEKLYVAIVLRLQRQRK
jgi:hypothetical protein